jgi:hypothetical protein
MTALDQDTSKVHVCADARHAFLSLQEDKKELKIDEYARFGRINEQVITYLPYFSY